MSGWTILTMRAKRSKKYDRSRWDENDPAHALEDLAATVNEDDERVVDWTVDSPHIYVYLQCDRYNWDFAESFMEDYESMIRDAVVLGANDTSDTGTARYYPSPKRCTDEYKETQSEDGCYVGKIAMSVINARHGIVSRDPFHDWLGRFDEDYAEDGESQL